MTPAEFDYLRAYLKQQSGLVLTNEMQYLIESRLLDAARGDANAYFDLGIAFSTGSGGVDVDLIQAHKWFNLAALGGNIEGQQCRADRDAFLADLGLDEPGLNRATLECARHYQTVILPARPRKPQDKAKAEVAVQVVERWIMARLRHHQPPIQEPVLCQIRLRKHHSGPIPLSLRMARARNRSRCATISRRSGSRPSFSIQTGAPRV